jgi:hypothetical protein
MRGGQSGYLATIPFVTVGVDAKATTRVCVTSRNLVAVAFETGLMRLWSSVRPVGDAVDTPDPATIGRRGESIADFLAAAALDEPFPSSPLRQPDVPPDWALTEEIEAAVAAHDQASLALEDALTQWHLDFYGNSSSEPSREEISSIGVAAHSMSGSRRSLERSIEALRLRLAGHAPLVPGALLSPESEVA